LLPSSILMRRGMGFFAITAPPSGQAEFGHTAAQRRYSCGVADRLPMKSPVRGRCGIAGIVSARAVCAEGERWPARFSLPGIAWDGHHHGGHIQRRTPACTEAV
jgi:hypothetical protein